RRARLMPGLRSVREGRSSSVIKVSDTDGHWSLGPVSGHRTSNSEGSRSGFQGGKQSCIRIQVFRVWGSSISTPSSRAAHPSPSSLLFGFLPKLLVAVSFLLLVYTKILTTG
ncbi:hypothetical protein U1Q18_027435, partial [Sarracenia purpurea var. burkii]